MAVATLDCSDMSPAPSDDFFETLVVPAIVAAVHMQDHRQVQAWILDSLQAMQRTDDTSVPLDRGRQQQLASGLARAIWNVTPLPRNGFRPDPIPIPGRNDTCPCGSGRKYKHCCMDVERNAPPPLTEAHVWPIVLAALTRKQTEEAIALKRVPIEAAIERAVRLSDVGKPAQAIAVLEPFLDPLSRFDERADHAFDTLCSLYDDAGSPAKKMTLIERVLAKAPRSPLRASAWSRLASIRSDNGDSSGAWEAFRAAQRDNSDDPMLGVLEVQLLVAENRMTEARERARFWRGRLERIGDGDLAGLIDWLRQLEQNPHATLARSALDSVGDRQHRLLQWAKSLRDRPLPAYVVVPDREMVDEPDTDAIGERLRALGVSQAEVAKHRGELERQIRAFAAQAGERNGNDTGAQESGLESPPAHVVKTPPQLRALERRWTEVVPFSKPFSTHDAPMDEVACWEPAILERWLDFLSAEASAADSVSILDDVATALGMHPLAGQRSFDEELRRPVLERAVAILEAALEKAGGSVRLAWLITENRPALRSLARLYAEHASAGRETAALSTAQRLLQLNPDDNHAMRAIVLRELLVSGRNEEALALARRFEDDMLVDIQYGAALALFRLGKLEEATVALRRCVTDRPNVPRYLIREQIRRPKLHDLGITVGGNDEAWIYREAMRDAWASTPGALEWLSKVTRQVSARRS